MFWPSVAWIECTFGRRLSYDTRSVRNDDDSWSIGDTLREGLLELAAVLPDMAIDNGRRRHPLEDVVAVVCGIGIAEWGSGMGIFDGDILLTAVLTVEVKYVFDGLEVAGFILISGGIFDVVEGRFVFTGGCNGGSGISGGSLVAVVSAATSIFSTERLDASGVEALEECFEQH